MRVSKYLWGIPVVILFPIGFVLGGIGAGCLLLMDVCLDKMPIKKERRQQ
jgi:hypothetical protein